MKLNVGIFIAALSGMASALFIYDYFIVQPRAMAQAKAVTDAATIDLAKAQAQANKITRQLDESVRKTLADAEGALNRQSDDLETRRLIFDAFSRAANFKTAVAEASSAYGRLPKNAAEAGTSDLTGVAGEAVSSISLAKNGVIVITLNERLAKNATFRLIPTLDPQTFGTAWRCESENYPALVQYMPQCSAK